MACLLAISGLLAGVLPEDAATSGGGTFEGTATLSAGFPCSNCGGAGFAGTASLSLSGVPQAGLTYTATWPDPRTTRSVPTNLTATFGYTDECLVIAPVPPLVGNASGLYTLSGGMLVLNGTVWDNATLTGAFTWERVGLTGYITLVGMTLTGGSGPSQVAVNLNNAVVGVGAATFVWTNGPGTCTVQNPSQTAKVAGVLAQPA